MDASDLLISISTFAVMSFIFGETFLEIPFTLVLPSLLLLGLTMSKKNKPESFLIHAFQYYLSPGHYACQDTKGISPQ